MSSLVRNTKKAEQLRAHAKGRCKKGAHRYRELYAKARKLSQKIARIHDNWEREAAKQLCAGASLIVREDLRLKNMMGSGTGTVSAPGSSAKKGLNRGLNEARIGKLDTRIERRCVKTGTDTVVVHPGNTSNTCNLCGHKATDSRDGEDFACVQCGYKEDADYNASVNIKGRGKNVFRAWRAPKPWKTVRQGGAGGTLVQKGKRRGSGTGTAGAGGAWRSTPGQPPSSPIDSKQRRGTKGTALTSTYKYKSQYKSHIIFSRPVSSQPRWRIEPYD